MTANLNPAPLGPDQQPDLTASDPYRLLGVSPVATQSEIKHAYFALIRQYPPETEAETFKRIRTAYEKIKDTQRRHETDIFRPQPPPAWQPDELEVALDTAFHASDVKLILRRWAELGRTDFQADFKEINL
jgi:curved DNA-binding protein CbpA